MVTIVFGTDRPSLEEGLYDKEVIRSGSLVFLVHDADTPEWAQAFRNDADDGSAYLHVYDGGILLARGDDYATTDEMLETPPEPGMVRWYLGGPTYIRLGSPPAFEIRVSALAGYTGTSDGIPPSSSTFLAEVGVDESDILGRTYVLPRYVDNPDETYLDVLNDSAAAMMQTFGFNRLDQYVSTELTPPTGDPVYTFTHGNTIDIARVLPEGMGAPMWRFALRVGSTWPVPKVAAGADSQIADEITRQPFFHSWSHEEPDVKLKHLLAEEVVVETKAREPQNTFTWELYRDRWFALFGVEREQVTVTVDVDGNTLALDLNDVVMVRMPRFGWDDGKLFRIIVQRFDLSRRRCEFTLWG